jgi:cytochrome bd-I ubiquinol oxidase subunit X
MASCTEPENAKMWYFSWILGLGLALTFGVLNALWYEIPHATVGPDSGDRPLSRPTGI